MSANLDMAMELNRVLLLADRILDLAGQHNAVRRDRLAGPFATKRPSKERHATRYLVGSSKGQDNMRSALVVLEKRGFLVRDGDVIRIVDRDGLAAWMSAGKAHLKARGWDYVYYPEGSGDE